MVLGARRVADLRSGNHHHGQMWVEGAVSPHARFSIRALGPPPGHDLQHARCITRDAISITETVIGVLEHHSAEGSRLVIRNRCRTVLARYATSGAGHRLWPSVVLDCASAPVSVRRVPPLHCARSALEQRHWLCEIALYGEAMIPPHR